MKFFIKNRKIYTLKKLYNQLRNMGVSYNIKFGKTLLLIYLIIIFSILLICDCVKANPLPVFSRYNYNLTESVINIISLFIVNLPINLSCILVFHFILIKRFKLAGVSKIPSLVSFFNLAIIVTFTGSIIDAYFFNYQYALLSIVKIGLGFVIGAFIIGIILIFLSFLIFSKLILEYPRTTSMSLGFMMIVVNIAFWFIFMSPSFKGIDSTEIFEFHYYLSLIFGIFLLIVTIIVVILLYSKFGKKFQLPITNRSSLDKARLRLVIDLVIIFLITMVYLSPIINYHQDDLISPENAVVHDLSINEKGDHHTYDYSNNYEKAMSGYTQENSESELMVDILSGKLSVVNFELTWEDEQVENILYINNPDRFQIRLKKPSGDFEESSISDSGKLEFTYSVNEIERQNWNESIDFFIVARDCGDQETLLRTIPDNGNNWTVNVSHTTFNTITYSRTHSIYWIYIWIYNLDLLWILMILIVISMFEVMKRKSNYKATFQRIG